MKMRKIPGRQSQIGFAALAFVGFLLMLTEKDGGAWAGTFIGAAMFLCGALAILRTKIERR